MIRPEDQRHLQPYLLPRERLLWAGRPRQGLVFRTADFYLVPFGLLIAALPFVDFTNRSLAFLASGGERLLFTGFLLYATFGRFLHDAWFRSGLLYAVTDQRVILLKTRRRRLQSLEIGYLPRLELELLKDGRGTLSFQVEDSESSSFGNAYSSWSPSGSNHLAFEQIEYPQRVRDLVAKESERRYRELTDSSVVDPLFLR